MVSLTVAFSDGGDQAVDHASARAGAMAEHMLTYHNAAKTFVQETSPSPGFVARSDVRSRYEPGFVTFQGEHSFQSWLSPSGVVVTFPTNLGGMPSGMGAELARVTDGAHNVGYVGRDGGGTRVIRATEPGVDTYAQESLYNPGSWPPGIADGTPVIGSQT